MGNYRTVTGIAIYDLAGNKLEEVNDLTAAKTYTKISKSRISDCLYNRSNYAGKFQFRYKYGTRVNTKLPKIK